MWKNLYTLALRITLVAGVLLSFLLLIELLRAFAFFYRIHQILGIGFAIMTTLLALWAVGQIWVPWRRLPRPIVPPKGSMDASATQKQKIHYIRYLCAYITRLAQNPILDPMDKQEALARVDDLKLLLRAHPMNDDLDRAMHQAENEVIAPCLSSIREQANAEIRKGSRDVMLAVTLSPYHSVDLLIVLYRNAAMVLRIARLYQNRPDSRNELLVLRDTFRVVALLNFLYVSRHLIESLFEQLPLIGRAVDDIGQGLGAGLLTSATGHAAARRCEAFTAWNKEEAAEDLAVSLRDFSGDVRDLFTRDILPELKSRIFAYTPRGARDQPGFWDSVTRGIASSVDTVAHTTDRILLKPAIAGTQAAVRASHRAMRSTNLSQDPAESVEPILERHVRRSRPKRHGNPVGRISRSIGNWFRYGLRGPRP